MSEAESTDVRESMGTFVDRLREAATVETVYGDPIERGGRTVVPVARVSFGFGGGWGSAPGEDEDGGGAAGPGQTGGGGGGGVSATPVGALEISDDETRFVRFGRRRRAVGALAVGALVGWLLGRR